MQGSCLAYGQQEQNIDSCILKQANGKAWRTSTACSNTISGLAKLIQQCFAERRREMGDIFGGKTRLRTNLCEAEDVVNEEQHILTLSITEVLSNSQPCKDTQHFRRCMMWYCRRH